MALPTTISGVVTGAQNSFHGPFISSQGNVYVILHDSTTISLLEAWKATDPTSSFSEQDTSNRPNVSSGAVCMNVVQVGDLLHVGQFGLDPYYARFKMHDGSSGDTWEDVTTTGGDQDQEISPDPNGTQLSGDLAVRTGQSDVLAVFHYITEPDMGTNYERLAFDTKADLTTGAWGGSPAYIGSNGMGVAVDVTGPRAVYEAVSGRTHVVFLEDGGTPALHHSSISSGDTETANGDIAESPAVHTTTAYPIGHGILFDRGGTKKIRFPYIDDGSDISIVEFNDADSPSYTFEDGVDGTNDVAIDNGSINACLAVDDSTAHLMHVRTSDDDLYSANDADTDTWTAPASSFTGTVNHISCNVIDRSGLKLAHIIDDGGTIKYDEDELAAVAPSGIIDQTLPSLTQSATASSVGGAIAQTLPSLTQSATALEIYTSTIAQTLPALTQSATASVAVPITATIGQTLPSLTQSATAALEYTATTAQTLPSLTQNATAAEKFEGPIVQTLPALSQSATAIESYPATISQTLPSLAQSATATSIVDITGAIIQTLPSLAQSATVVEIFTGTITQTLPALAQSANAISSTGISGSIIQTLPSLSQSATATLEYPATINQTLPALSQSVVAEITYSGGITQTLPALTQSAIGELTYSGAIGQTLPSLTQSATSELTYSGAITPTLPSLSQSANATVTADISGSIDQTLPSLTQSATTLEIYTSTIDQTLPALTQSATANIGAPVTATIDQTLPSLTQSATTVVEYAATAAQTLPGLTQSLICNVIPSPHTWRENYARDNWRFPGSR